MKLQFISDIKAKASAHKKISALICVVVIIGLAAGVYFGWQQYKYRQSSLYAMEKIKDALNPPDPAQLARLADFNALSTDMAKASQESFPFFLAGADQERNIKHRLQTALLKRFLDKEQKGSAFPEAEDEQSQLQKPLEILPHDFVSQIISSLNVRNTDPDTALLNAKIDNPLLKQDFNLVMSMHKTAAGWKITHLVNAKELAGQLRAAMLKRHAALRNVFLSKNEATTKRMDQLLPIQSCTADAGLMSDGKTMLMIVHVLARNVGNVQVNNFNVDTAIYSKSGKFITRRFLNTAKPVAPGEDFNHRWNFEMESSNPLARELLRNSPLQCRASWQTLGLNNAEVLHIVEVPNPDQACAIPGHNHPDGFCITPVFLN